MPRWEWDAPAALAPWLAGVAASADDGAPEPVRVLPDGGADLLFSTRAAGGAWTAEVFGPKTQALLVHDGERMEKIAVRLRPGACARWLGVPARLLVDEALPLAALWGRDAEELTERLERARSRGDQRACVEASLLARAGRVGRPPALIEAAVARVTASRGRIGMRALARELGANERRLERAFGEHLGLAPKRFARIVRFAAARRALARGASQLEAALAAGYHDQAHLHRDSRAFAGCTPAAFAANVAFSQDTGGRPA